MIRSLIGPDDFRESAQTRLLGEPATPPIDGILQTPQAKQEKGGSWLIVGSVAIELFCMIEVAWLCLPAAQPTLFFVQTAETWLINDSCPFHGDSMESLKSHSNNRQFWAILWHGKRGKGVRASGLFPARPLTFMTLYVITAGRFLAPPRISPQKKRVKLQMSLSLTLFAEAEFRLRAMVLGHAYAISDAVQKGWKFLVHTSGKRARAGAFVWGILHASRAQYTPLMNTLTVILLASNAIVQANFCFLFK